MRAPEKVGQRWMFEANANCWPHQHLGKSVVEIVNIAPLKILFLDTQNTVSIEELPRCPCWSYLSGQDKPVE